MRVEDDAAVGIDLTVYPPPDGAPSVVLGTSANPLISPTDPAGQPQIYLEIATAPTPKDSDVILRSLVLSVDHAADLAAQLERAGKAALYLSRAEAT